MKERDPEETEYEDGEDEQDYDGFDGEEGEEGDMPETKKERMPKAQDQIVIIGGSKDIKKTLGKKSELEAKQQLIANAPTEHRAYLEKLLNVENEIARTSVFRLTPLESPDGVPLKINKVIWDYPEGIMRVDQIVPILEQSTGGGRYLVIYKDGNGKTRVTKQFEIDGAPLVTVKEEEAHLLSQGIRPNRRTKLTGNESEDEVAKIRKEEERLEAAHELRRKKRRLQAEEEEELGGDEDFDEFAEPWSPVPRFRRGRRGGFLPPMPQPFAQADPEKLRLEAEEKARLESDNKRLQDKLYEKSEEKPKPATDWAGIVMAALPIIGGITEKVLDKLDKIAESLKPKERDPIAELDKIASVVEKISPKKESLDDKLKFLEQSAKSAGEMQSQTVNSLMQTLVKVASQKLLDGSGVQEPEEPAVAIVGKVMEGITRVGGDLLEAKREEAALKREEMSRHQALPPGQFAPPAPRSMPMPANPAGLAAPGKKLLNAAIAAWSSGVSPEEFARQTREIGGDDLLKHLLEADSIESLRPIAVANGMDTEFSYVCQMQVAVQWVDQWLQALKARFKVREVREQPSPPAPGTGTEELFDGEGENEEPPEGAIA